MKPELIKVPKHFPGCATCEFALAALEAAQKGNQPKNVIRTEIEISCVPPDVHHNSTRAILTADVTHVHPSLRGTSMEAPFHETVQCPVAVERLLNQRRET
ncbi:hypothetical protein HY339_00330 [Candidatus Gottesmanbacteria bacterium]|nr:hypothetical protein [Candidatus Gottesmanbacteria bacterium]